MPDNANIKFNPYPTTIGCLCIAILSEAAKEESNKIQTIIKSFLRILINNLKSSDQILMHYSFNLLNSCIDKFEESTICEILNQGIFMTLCQIQSTNAVMLSCKLFKSREKAQRLFLKNNGYAYIIFCLVKFKEEAQFILQAISYLLIVLHI